VADQLQLTHPWLIAVWPGMGHVALNAGVYLLAKLGMTAVAEAQTGDLFDADHVEVKDGLVQPPRRPRNRFFVWTDPDKKRDLVVFLGEAQPPLGKYTFCKQIVASAQEHGVERVFTFAAMATQMDPDAESRVFAAATDESSLDELKRLDLTILEDGHIGGLNGVLLGAAGEAGLRGSCLLGELPHIFAQFPYPKASLAILEIFKGLAGIDLDLTELAEQAEAADRQLHELLARAREENEEEDEESEFETNGGEPEEIRPAATAETRPDPADVKKIEELFDSATKDRSKAFELKRELDRLGLFKQYEDRFLDLFRKSDAA
jgi:proteasome assembly chaperone (PAC2) family protein